MTSEVVRNVVMLQCIYYASVYNDLVLYKHTYINQKDMDGQESPMSKKGGNVSMRDL